MRFAKYVDILERRGYMKNYTHGQLIRQYREEEGLTQEELADIIKVSVIKLNHWETNETVPNPRMVARLAGALRLSDEKEKKLNKAIAIARAYDEEIRAEAQKIIDAQNEEAKRLYHKEKTLFLLWSILGGFAVSLLFFTLTGKYKDVVWYFPILIGFVIASIPFGWSILTDKSNAYYKTPYSPNPEIQQTEDSINLISFVLKFIGAYLIGIVVFPIALFYHAYKAGRKGTLYKKVVGLVFILVVIFIGIIVFIIAGASTGN